MSLTEAAQRTLGPAERRPDHLGRTHAGYLAEIERYDPHGQGILAERRRGGADASGRNRSPPPGGQAGRPAGRLAGGGQGSALHEGELTTCGSRMLENFRPPYDATVVAKLKAADAVLIGKTNMDEFAMGGSTENSAFFTTRNPWDLERIPGGSSGGAAACVAAGMAPLSIGTDTGGSIRQPAGLCGVTGLKPTYGRVSRYGLVAFASSLDQIGPLARTAEDAALLLEVIAGHDPRDSTSVRCRSRAIPKRCASRSQGLRLGLVREHFGEGLDAEVEAAVREAIRVYESLGAKVKEISLPHGKYGVATYYIIAPCEASSNLARYDGVHYGHRTDEAAMLAELADERRALMPAGKHAEAEETRQSAGADVSPQPGRRFWARSEAADHARHLCPERRLLRRLLPQGPQSPPPDPPGLRQGVRASRSDRRPGHDDARPSRSAKNRRSAGDVPGRSVHGEREPGRHRRHRRFPAASAPATCRSACNCRRRRSTKSGCCAPPTCSRGDRLAHSDARTTADDEENRRWTPMNADVTPIDLITEKVIGAAYQSRECTWVWLFGESL